MNQVIVIYINNLFRNESDISGLRAVDIITPFLLNPPGVIGVILYGDPELLDRLFKLRPEFMGLFVDPVKEPDGVPN
jgi:hypothetical protein